MSDFVDGAVAADAQPRLGAHLADRDTGGGSAGSHGSHFRRMNAKAIKLQAHSHKG
jgi:hypothetical protein